MIWVKHRIPNNPMWGAKDMSLSYLGHICYFCGLGAQGDLHTFQQTNNLIPDIPSPRHAPVLEVVFIAPLHRKVGLYPLEISQTI